MSPSKATDDYYFILKVDQKDDLETITTSWKRLALLLHPDKNPGKDTTAEFQLVRCYILPNPNISLSMPF